MTVDEAIKRYTNNAEYERTHGNLQGCLDFRQLAEWLSELKQLREQTNWIPVSEGLPNKSGKYWCTFGGSNLVGNDYYTTESDAKELFDDLDDLEEYVGWQSKNVIAWMPLPLSYQGEENG